MFKANVWELKDRSPQTKQKLISPEKKLFCVCDRLGIIHFRVLHIQWNTNFTFISTTDSRKVLVQNSSALVNRKIFLFLYNNSRMNRTWMIQEINLESAKVTLTNCYNFDHWSTAKNSGNKSQIHEAVKENWVKTWGTLLKTYWEMAKRHCKGNGNNNRFSIRKYLAFTEPEANIGFN